MDLGIKGKSALVFGASSGIGKGIAKELAREGVNLFLVSRTTSALESLALELMHKYNINATWLSIDIGERNAAKDILRKVSETDFCIDILINISGGPKNAEVLEVSYDDLHFYFNEVLATFIELTPEIAKEMVKKKWGRIITVTSSGVFNPIPDLVISNTLRSALTNWSKTLANSLAPHGVTVNTLVPGRIVTNRVNEIDTRRAESRGISKENVVKESQNSIPMKRYGSIHEIASVAVFLVSCPASYITGCNIRVDGGLIQSTF